MAKGRIEWEYDTENGLVLRFNPVPGILADGEVRRHILSARKEMLLALRSLIDVAVERTEGKEGQGKNGGTRIKVD
ncbi:MAG: hypothetical protein JXA46_02250 [Dehalococcoidales bacterium]|nr:hypothetical protein [Dehalococcoidales bacterium]